MIAWRGTISVSRHNSIFSVINCHPSIRILVVHKNKCHIFKWAHLKLKKQIQLYLVWMQGEETLSTFGRDYSLK